MKSKEILDVIYSYYPDSTSELKYNNDYELLLSVMLSAQSTDKRVNEVTKPIYEKYNTLDKLSTLTEEEIQELIKSIGFYKQKAKSFKKIVESIKKIGYVPNDREFLEQLPGVGRKTANVILAELYNEPCIAVDTHVYRIAKRLGITNNNDDVKSTEEKLMKFFPKEEWSKINGTLVLFGRYRCKAKKPECIDCKLKSICRYKEKNE